MVTQYQITDGPSKWDLMLALFDGDSASRHRVRFSNELVDPRYPAVVYVCIDELSREDGSGECWNFKGRAYQGVNEWKHLTNCKVGGFFTTRQRGGHISVSV